ncbi:MAG: methyltransferase MtaB domain-containing protein, partial [Bacillota bacterium]|nr:methyltransferase MtaB domain-containing protein [Bacillota bacterium]
VAIEAGAVGPDKDCGYEGVYMKAITGTPISMEGRTSACAHSSTVGNIVGSMCDFWSNESVENNRLLGGMAPTVYTEQLIYDCRMMNTAKKLGKAKDLQEVFIESDVHLDPHAYIMDPKVVIEISKKIVAAKGHFARTKVAGLATIDVLRKGHKDGSLILADRDAMYLDIMEDTLNNVTDDVEAFTAEMLKSNTTEKFVPAQYDM